MTLTLINMLEYCQKFYDNEYLIFDDISIPNDIDKEILINTIFDKSATNIVLVDNVLLLHKKIQNFFKKNYLIYDRLVKAFNQDYNPLENYDRMEDMNTYYNRDRRLNNEHSDITRNVEENNNTINSNDNTENTTSAFNSNTYQPDNHRSEVTNTIDNNKRDGTSDNKGGYEDNESIDDKTNTNGRIHGNIGVTTSQQMLLSELEVRPKLNIYEVIANDFYNEFMIKVMI